MKKTIDNIASILVITITIILCILNFYFMFKNTPSFKVNECAKDQIHGDVRKIVEVKEFMYIYRISSNNSKRQYSMRISDFDRIMVKLQCKE